MRGGAVSGKKFTAVDGRGALARRVTSAPARLVSEQPFRGARRLPRVAPSRGRSSGRWCAVARAALHSWRKPGLRMPSGQPAWAHPTWVMVATHDPAAARGRPRIRYHDDLRRLVVAVAGVVVGREIIIVPEDRFRENSDCIRWVAWRKNDGVRRDVTSGGHALVVSRTRIDIVPRLPLIPREVVRPVITGSPCRWTGW